MKNLIKFVLLLLACQLTYAQKLVYKNCGNIKDDKGENLSSAEVRTLLSSNQTLLEEYNIGRSKKTVGNVLLVGGLSLSTGVSAIQLFAGQPVSIELVAVGFVSMLVAIPVKIGFTKKIKNVVAEFNNQKSVTSANFNIQSMDLIANSNGFGIKLTIN